MAWEEAENHLAQFASRFGSRAGATSVGGVSEARPPAGDLAPPRRPATWSETTPDSFQLACYAGHSHPNTPPVSNPKTSPSITLFQILLQV